MTTLEHFHHRHDDDDDPLDLTDRELLVVIFRKLVTLMTSVAQFQTILDSIRVDLTAVANDATSAVAGFAALKQLILDLQAQVKAGTGPVTQAQLDSVATSAQAVDDQLKAIDATLKPLASTVPVTPPVAAPKLALVPVIITIGVPTSFVLMLAPDSGLPVDATVAPLPAGLIFDPATGMITGTPTGPLGPTSASVSVRNTAGSDSGTLVVTVSDVAQPPVQLPPVPAGAQSVGARSAVAGTEPVDHNVKS